MTTNVQKYNLDAITACRDQMQSVAPKFGSAADGIKPGSYGELAGGKALADAVQKLGSQLGNEFNAARQLSDEVARSLEKVLQSVKELERANTQILTA